MEREQEVTETIGNPEASPTEVHAKWKERIEKTFESGRNCLRAGRWTTSAFLAGGVLLGATPESYTEFVGNVQDIFPPGLENIISNAPEIANQVMGEIVKNPGESITAAGIGIFCATTVIGISKLSVARQERKIRARVIKEDNE